MNQQFPGQRLLIGWRALFDTEPTIDALMTRIAMLPRAEALRFLANFDAAIFQSNLQSRNENYVILGAFGKGLPLNYELQAALLRHPGSAIFSEIQVRTLATLCNTYASDSLEIQHYEIHVLFECCLLFNSLFIDSYNDSGIEYAKAVELRAMLTDNVTASLPQERNVAYLVWLSKRSAELGFDILDSWHEARGSPLSDHYIATWELLKPLVEHNIDAPETSIVIEPTRIPDPTTAATMSRWVRDHSLSNSHPRATIPLQYSDDVKSRRQPFVEIRPGVYVCISRQSLAHLLADTLFFDAADCIPDARPDLRESYFVKHGDFLNAFALDLAKRAASPVDTVDGDFSVPGRGKATDVIWLQGDCIFLFEVVAKRFNFEHSVHGLSNSSIDSDFQKMTLSKVDQLKWNIQALLDGAYADRFHNFEPGKTAIQPVILTLNFSPHVSMLRDHLMNRSSSELESLGALPLEVITFADFQMLDGFASIGITLRELLDDKRNTPLSQLTSFRNFVVQNHPDKYKAAYKHSVKRLRTLIDHLINLPGQAPSIKPFMGSIKRGRPPEWT